MTRFGVLWPLGVSDPKTHAKSIANLGVKEVRLQFSWRQIERTEGSRDWSYYDELIDGVIRPAGLGVLPMIYQTPGWHRPSEKDAPDPWKYAAFVVEAVRHFNFRNGVEVWNEPDNPWDLDWWKANAAQYADLYRVTRQALHAYDPTRLAILGGLTYIDSGIPYLKSIWDRLGPLDGVGFHPYGFGPDPVADTMSKLKSLIGFLNAKGCSAPVDVTEVGMDVPPHQEKQRAGYLKELAYKIKIWKRVRRFDVFLWWAPPEGGMDVWSIARADGNWKGGASAYAAGIKA